MSESDFLAVEPPWWARLVRERFGALGAVVGAVVTVLAGSSVIASVVATVAFVTKTSDWLRAPGALLAGRPAVAAYATTAAVVAVFFGLRLLAKPLWRAATRWKDRR